MFIKVKNVLKSKSKLLKTKIIYVPYILHYAIFKLCSLHYVVIGLLYITELGILGHGESSIWKLIIIL